jgi:hypothetical protein
MLVLVRKARSRLGPCGEKRTDLGDFRIFSLFVPKGAQHEQALRTSLRMEFSGGPDGRPTFGYRVNL